MRRKQTFTNTIQRIILTQDATMPLTKNDQGLKQDRLWNFGYSTLLLEHLLRESTDLIARKQYSITTKDNITESTAAATIMAISLRRA